MEREPLNAAFNIIGGCTAVRVGEKLILTAAHCVFDSDTGSMGSRYQSGQPLALSSAPLWGLDNIFNATIDVTHVHPEWASDCRTPGTPCARRGLPDVAVIVTHEALTPFAVIPVGHAPVEIGALVFVTGFGCEVGVGDGVTGLDEGITGLLFDSDGRLVGPRLKAVEVQTIASEAVDEPEGLGDLYVITPGLAMNPEAASLCPGDSGGPLFRDDCGRLTVVGINAYYSFSSAEDVVSLTNWHTRLDGAWRHGVGGWLASLGVLVD